MSKQEEPLVSVSTEGHDQEDHAHGGAVANSADAAGATTVTTGAVGAAGEVINDVDVIAGPISADLTSVINTSGLTEEQVKELEEIQNLIRDVKCSKFHGRGRLEDYKELILKAQSVNLDQTVDLNFDLSELNEAAETSEQLSEFILNVEAKISRVSQVNISKFLHEVREKVRKISSVQHALEKFHVSLYATAEFKIPAAIKNVTSLLNVLNDEVRCSKQYIDYYTGLTKEAPKEAELSGDDKLAMDRAIAAIDLWVKMAEQGFTAALKDNKDIIDAKHAVSGFKDISFRRNIELLAQFKKSLKL
jgi:hypothetical protein